MFSSLVQDVRYGLRNLVRNPGFALVAMLTLALGIGANTTIFSIINSTVLRPISFPDPGGLVLVLQTNGKGPHNWNIVSAPNFWDFERHAHSFENMAIFDSAGRGYNLASAGNSRDAERVSGLRVTAGFFKVLGVAPMIGRTFAKEEETLGKDHEVVLSYGLWRDRYDGDLSLVGRSIRIDGEDFTVIGVMPKEFQWQFWSGPRKLWVPVGYTKTDFSRGENSFLAIARLKPGVTLEQARQEMESIGEHVRQENPKDDADMGATVLSLSEFGMEGTRTTMFTILAAVAFVMLIACVNVANLLLARGAARQREFAVRRALGAGGARIAQQMMTESVLLGLIGGGAGLAIAAVSTRIVFSTFQFDKLNLPLRPIDSLSLDGRVFGFTLAISLLTGLLFGLAPALGALRPAPNDSLKKGGRTGTGARNRVRHMLVAAEVALALVVLCGAGLMIKSMTTLLGVDPGFDPKNVLVMDMTTPQEIIYNGPPGLPRFCQDLDEHAGTMSGIVSVSAAAHLPMYGGAGRSFQIEGRPPAQPGKFPGGNYTVACPNYFRTLGIPIIRGREFSMQDTLTSPGVVVINEAMARAFWPNEDAIGKAIRWSDGSRLTIVGVVGNVHGQGLDTPGRRQLFRPYTQAGWPSMSIVARTAGATSMFDQPVKKMLAGTFVDRPVSRSTTMEEIVGNSLNNRRFTMLLLSVFSVVALVLAAVGIVGVVGHSVTQRTQEIGIRMALGARSVDVLRMIVGGNMTWVLGGLAAGVGGAAALTRLLTGMLYEVRPFDPLVIGGVASLLAAVALIASYLPARRAAKIDPIAALRCD